MLARLYLALCCALALIAPAAGQSSSLINGGAVTCPVVTGTLTALNSTVQSQCPGASSYEVVIVPNQTTPLNATIQFSDPVSGVNRALFKAGVGELDVSSVPMTGTLGTASYRMVSLNGAAVTVSAYTSGSATVTIYGSFQTVGTFLNNPIHTSEEGSLRLGRAFTASTSVVALTSGQNLSFVLTNPANNNQRLIITSRVLACDAPTGTTARQYYGISNPTVNLPATAATVSNRRTGGAASLATAAYGAATTRPDTSPTTANPIGGVLPTGGINYVVPGLTTVEPGTSRGNWIANPTGLGTATNCSIIYQWLEEPVQ